MLTPHIIESEIHSYVDHPVSPETPRIKRDTLESLRVQAECGVISKEFFRRMKETIENSPHLKVA